MRKSISWIVSLLILSVLSSAVTLEASDTENTKRLAEGASPPPAKASDLNWLVGQWRGEGLGGVCEEAWVPASGGSMLGIFRLLKDGKNVFYEFIVITEAEGTISVRLKHFNPDMTGWEEKDKTVDFRLVELGENVAYFNGLTYRLDGDTLKIYLALKGSEGVREEAFVFHRMD